MGDLDGKGILFGIVVWVILISFMANEMTCVKYERCGSNDLILFTVIGIGFTVPSAIVAMLTSGIFTRNKK